jgi:hypothetical protein
VHLTRIRFRDVLNQVQAALANATGVARSKPERHSHDWRQALNTAGKETIHRRNHARLLLENSFARAKYLSLSNSDAAMDLLCEKDSSIRDDGDKVAHPNLSADELQDLRAFLPNLSNSYIKAGLDEVIKYLVSASKAS